MCFFFFKWAPLSFIALVIFSFFIRTKLQVIIDASSLDSVLRAPKQGCTYSPKS